MDLNTHNLLCGRVRELNIYCEIHPFNKIPSLNTDVKAVILSGSPFSVRDQNCPIPNLENIKGDTSIRSVLWSPIPTKVMGRCFTFKD